MKVWSGQVRRFVEAVESEDLIAGVLSAAADVWAALQRNHPGIPNVVIVGGTSGRSGFSQTHGHFWAGQWKHNGATRPEVYLSGESIARGAVATFGTLAHEAAHAYAHAKGIKDTSNAGRYHNRKFKAIAETFGLEIGQADVIGFSPTTVPDETAERYAGVIDGLAVAIQGYRAAPGMSFAGGAGGNTGGGAEPSTPKRARLKMLCLQCDNPTPVSQKWWDAHGGNLYCMEHATYYELLDV